MTTAKDIHCTFCQRVMRQVNLAGIRRFFCWILGHRVARSEFNQDGIPHPEKKEYCREELTCKYCRKEVSEGRFA